MKYAEFKIESNYQYCKWCNLTICFCHLNYQNQRLPSIHLAKKIKSFMSIETLRQRKERTIYFYGWDIAKLFWVSMFCIFSSRNTEIVTIFQDDIFYPLTTSLARHVLAFMKTKYLAAQHRELFIKTTCFCKILKI